MRSEFSPESDQRGSFGKAHDDSVRTSDATDLFQPKRIFDFGVTSAADATDRAKVFLIDQIVVDMKVNDVADHQVRASRPGTKLNR